MLAVQETVAEVDGAVETVARVISATAEAVPQGGGAAHLILLLTVFVLAVFLGIEIITKIPPTLHTPLMSGSNAISGITLVGAVLAAGGDNGTWATILGFSAILFATMNVVGGFVVTNRMLAMFRTKK
ncbi:MAG: NAD(P) transhydrogenase subunit alpha [Fuerstiella sp.]|nr:NAD(P) transhydrogenase subunit alpha [Fuerstiella sp.]MCP4783454.1 NAD(P) transhydrogenase subunit alpha [Fuerstiella sp.]MCP4857712.1 NAD(P) transhydrogenase subunit alpha [Fuerstiella sp.]